MTVTSPAGFRACGVTAGLKPSGTPDVALIANDGPSAVAAAVFTANRCKAHPVLWSEQVIADGNARAVLLNSGGANCYTGSTGFQHTRVSAERVAEGLDVSAGDVAVCSTGLIGEQLAQDKLSTGIDAAVPTLSRDGGAAAAEAIRTTDTYAKQVLHSGQGFSVGGMAKGAGMLAPALATMLVVVTTDADLDAETADAALREAGRVTFERLDSDGCMSTNDTVLLMCSGASGVRPGVEEFTSVLTRTCHGLAMELLGDAEGADHDITIEVDGAASEADVVEVGRAVARSNLVKCAIYGRDPNWGRILAAVGTTQAEFEPTRLDVSINGVCLCRDSSPAQSVEEVDLAPREARISIDLKVGAHAGTVWTNDLTHAYVEENSAYST